MEVEDERTISISFPEDWEPAQLAGLSVDAKIKLRVRGSCALLFMDPGSDHAVAMRPGLACS